MSIIQTAPRFDRHSARTIANLAHRQLGKTGGFTIGIPSLQNPPRFGYVAAFAGAEKNVGPLATVSPDTLADYLVQNPPSRGQFFGGYPDEDTADIILDASAHFADIVEAFRFAKQNAQKSIYDIARDCTYILRDFAPDIATGKPVDNVQPHSTGATYPIGIYFTSDNRAHLWNLRTNQTVLSFSGPDRYKLSEQTAQAIARSLA